MPEEDLEEPPFKMAASEPVAVAEAEVRVDW